MTERNLGEVITIFEEAKAMFRQQIEDAWKDGENCGADGHRSYNINAQSKIYYTNKYGKQ